jgi:hypothetical protein
VSHNAIRNRIFNGPFSLKHVNTNTKEALIRISHLSDLDHITLPYNFI